MRSSADLGRRLTAWTTALAAAFTLAAAAAPASAEPALWVIHDADSTVYLFGTVHMLRDTTEWKSPKIADAIARSQDLTLEIADLNPAPATLAPIIQKYGVDPARPLSSKLTAQDNVALARLCKLYGLSRPDLEPLQPWLVVLQLSIAPLIKAGYDPGAGPDRLLKASADQRGEPVAGLETMDEQIAYFANLPQDIQIEWLRQAIDEAPKTVTELDALEGAWEAGDVDSIARILNDDMKTAAPSLYDRLLIQRNKNFARQIKAKLAGHGVSFIAVGAAHLAGPDSVQAELEKLGVKVERE
jgi:uncharacterized protein YbaP (TraB family)